jgi:lysophospholipase L1-like esterase
MKKVLLIILISFLGRDLIGQAITKRAGASVTVNDENLFVGKSFRVPVYTDTTAANLAVTLDSAGKLIFTYDINGLWLRESNPKKWVEVGSGGGIVSLGIVGNYGLTRINDSTYRVDTILIATRARLMHVADSLLAIIGAKTDTSRVNNLLNINQNPHTGLVFQQDSVVIYGDSYVQGQGATYQYQRWTSRLCELLNAVEDNHGVIGTTLEKRSPVNWIAAPNFIDALATLPAKTPRKKLLVIAYGLNEMGYNGGSYTPANYKTDFDSAMNYLTTTKGWDAKNILILPAYKIGAVGYTTYAGVSGNAAPTPSWHEQFVTAAKETAIKWGTLYFDIYNDIKRNDTTLLTVDGIHPTDSGHYFIAKDVYNYLTGGSQNFVGQTYLNGIDKAVPFFFSKGGTQIPAIMQQDNRFTYDSAGIVTAPTFRSNETATGVYSDIKVYAESGNTHYSRTKILTGAGGTVNSGVLVAPGGATGSTQIPSFLGISTNVDDLQASSKQAFHYITTDMYKIATYQASSTQDALDIHFGGGIGSTTDSKMIIKTDGKVGIGTTAPTAILHIATAGTAAAGTAPIKLNSGTALTTPEDGAIEYHGSHIYFTIGSTRYQLDQQAGTNLGNSDLTQSSSTRQYTIGYNSAAGQRYLSLGKLDASERTYMILAANSTNHNGAVYFGATDSTSGVQTASDYSPTSQRIQTAIRISGGKDARTNYYLDSLVLGFASTNYLTPKKVYNFGADSLIIKGNMGVSASSSDSVLVRGSDNVVVLRAQSDLGGGLLSGTYTPTLTNVANVAASTAYSCQYSRVGTVVTVSGEVDIDPTTTLTLTQLGISLPIASNLTATNELGGTSADDLGTAARVAGDATNNRAEVRMTPVDVTNRRFSFTFTYRIL